MQTFINIFKSKKFIALLIGLLTILGSGLAGVSPEALLAQAGVITVYMGGQAVSDATKETRQIELEQEKLMTPPFDDLNQDTSGR